MPPKKFPKQEELIDLSSVPWNPFFCMLFCEDQEMKIALSQNFKSQTYKILTRETVDAHYQEKLQAQAYEQDITVEEIKEEEKMQLFVNIVKERLDELWFQERKSKKEQLEALDKKKLEIKEKQEKGEEISEEELYQIQATFPFIDIYVWLQNFPMNKIELFKLEKMQFPINIIIYIEPRVMLPEQLTQQNEEEGDEEDKQKDEEEEEVKQARLLEFRQKEIERLKGDQWKLYQKFKALCRLSDMKSQLRNTYFLEQQQPEPPEEEQLSEDEEEEEEEERKQKPSVDLNALLWSSLQENLIKISKDFNKFIEWIKLIPIYPITCRIQEENIKKQHLQFSIPENKESANPEQEQEQNSKLEESYSQNAQIPEQQLQEEKSKIIQQKQLIQPKQVIPTSGIDDEPRTFDLSMVYKKIKQVGDINLTPGAILESLTEKLCGS